MDFTGFFSTLISNSFYKRVQTLSKFLNSLTKISDIKMIPRVYQVYQKEKTIRNFIDILEDSSKFNITKMNQSGLLVKTINKSTAFTKFLTDNATIIESSINKIKDVSKTGLFKAVNKSLKISTTFFKVISIGYKVYDNYKQTKSFLKTITGTAIDIVKDFDIIDGITYGAYFGKVGIAVGVGVGATVQIINFLNPNFFNNIKNKLHQGKISISTNTEVLIIDKETLEKRKVFYERVVSKLNDTLKLLEKYYSQFDELASGKTAMITKENIIAKINKVEHILNTHIIPTKDSLLHHQAMNNNVFVVERHLNQWNKNKVMIHKKDLKNQIYSLNNTIQLTKKLVNLDNDISLRRNISTLQNELSKLKKLENAINQLERSKFYV